MNEVKLAVRGYLVLGTWAALWIVAAVMCAKVSKVFNYDYKGAWPNALHDMPRDDTRSSLVQTEE